jgi:uncharacterized membrane protein
MRSITYYYSSKNNDQNEKIELIKKTAKDFDLVLVDICIDDDPDLEKRFADVTPAVQAGPYLIKSPFTVTDLEVAINSAMSRNTSSNSGEKSSEAFTWTRLDSFSLFLSKRYALIISILLSLFLAFPFLAPVLLDTGHTSTANIIYKFYSILCHQLTFRSFFIFGEQPIYPRQLAHVDNYLTYEQVTGQSVADLDYARKFEGNALMGYKVALCERDVAIYGSLLAFSIIFMLFGKKIKQIPWYFWFIFALLPIAIDGFSQIPGLSSGWPSWLPIRESTPFLRVLTGSLFGFGTAWYIFPLMEESMKDTRLILGRKIAIINKFSDLKK